MTFYLWTLQIGKLAGVYILGGLLCVNAVFSQHSLNVGGPSEDNGLAIAIDSSGNSFTTGLFRATVDFDPSIGFATFTSVGESDIFLASYDKNGLYRFSQTIGGPANDIGYDIAVDPTNNVYLTGAFQGTNVDFGPASGGVANLSSKGSNDAFVASYSNEGAFRYAISFGGSGGDRGQGIAVDTAGFVYVTGGFSGSADFDPGSGTESRAAVGGLDIFLASYDQQGNLRYVLTFGGVNNDLGLSVTLDNGGNVYVTGFLESNDVDFDPGFGTESLSSSGDRDIFVASYSNEGVFRFAYAFGGAGRDQGNAVSVDEGRNLYVAGYFEGSNIDFNPGSEAVLRSSNGGRDIFLASFTSAGSFRYANTWGGSSNDIASGLVANAGGATYLTGYFESTTVDFDPSASQAVHLNNGARDLFEASYDADGNYLGARSFGGIGIDQGEGIAIGSAKQCYLTGAFGGSIDFSLTGQPATLSSNGGLDIFIASYPRAIEVSVEDVPFQTELTSGFVLKAPYPNPFFDQVNLALRIEQTQNIQVTMYDPLGRVVGRIFETMVAADETQVLTLDALGLSAGLYFVRVVGEQFSATEQVMLLR